MNLIEITKVLLQDCLIDLSNYELRQTEVDVVGAYNKNGRLYGSNCQGATYRLIHATRSFLLEDEGFLPYYSLRERFEDGDDIMIEVTEVDFIKSNREKLINNLLD